MNIRIKLISILLFTSMVPLIVLSVIGVQMARESLRDEIGSNFKNIAAEEAQDLETLLTSKIDETKVLASHPMIIRALRKANDRYSKLSDAAALASILAVDREWVSQKGKMQTAATINANALSTLFKTYQDRDREKYGEIFVTDVKGANVAMTKALSDYYQADEAWWKQSYAEGKGSVFIDDRGFDESVGSIVVGAVVPVMDNGDVIGILKINFKVHDVINEINNVAKAGHEGIVITIARNSGSLVFSPGDARPRTATEAEHEILKEATAGWVFDEHDGTKTIMGYAPISVPIYSRILPTGSEKGIKGETWHQTVWFTLLDLDQDIAFAPIDKMTQTFLWFGFLAVMVVIAIALRLAHNISRPIRQLHEGAKAISEGHFDHRLSIDRNDEIGGLARAFTKMTAELNDMMALQLKLTQTIEQSPSMLLVTDLDGVIEYANREFYDVTGYAPEEVIGQTTRIIKSGKTPQAVYTDLWQTIKAGKVWKCEIEDRCKDGTLFWANATIAPIRSHDGVITHYSATHENITLRKDAESRMHAAKVQAEVASRAKSDLMANMSHELRTPLNAIIGFSGSIKEEIFGPIGNEKYQEYLDDIHDSGKHLLDLINDILDVSSIEAGAVELYEEKISVMDVVDASIRIISPRADEGKVTITSSIKSDVPTLFADERRLKQIFLNLLSNAVKFTPEGGSISVSSRQNDDGALVIAVVDTGIGMDADDLKKAMSKFGQVDSGLNRKHEGTGLGLPLTMGLVERHGGTMDVKSEKGRGTEITVTFPKERVA